MIKKTINAQKILNALSVLSKVLFKEGVIEGNKWHTVEFYLRKYGRGYSIDEFRTSNIKRDLIGIKVDKLQMPQLLLPQGFKKVNNDKKRI